MTSFSLPNELTEEEASGMTVNERLWVAGLLDDFDKAISQSDEEKFRSICERVFLSSENIKVLIDKYFKG